MHIDLKRFGHSCRELATWILNPSGYCALQHQQGARLPARDPQQTKCDCAKILCRSCYEKQKGVAGTCPTCRKQLDAFPDRNISRRLKALKVKCNTEGCPWENELGMLDDHIANCEYVITECTNGCQSSLCLCDLEHHLMEECPLRQYICEHCTDQGLYAYMIGEHLNVCPDIMVPCANEGCKAHMARKDLKDHNLKCPMIYINCPYVSIGCGYVSRRETMDYHNKHNTTYHLNLALVEIGKLRDDQVKLRDDQVKLRDDQVKLRDWTVCRKYFKMLGFEQHMATDEEWYSPGFYTYPNGYKMRFYVSASDACLQVYLSMMKGENDDNLVWPFHYTCAVSLLNQRRDGDHYARHWCSDDDNDDGDPHNTRVLVGEFHEHLYGLGNFISLEELYLQKGKDIQYLMDDCLHFMMEVKVLDECRPWLASAEPCK
eukprot:Em0017g618a